MIEGLGVKVGPCVHALNDPGWPRIPGTGSPFGTQYYTLKKELFTIYPNISIS